MKKLTLISMALLLLASCRMADLTESWPVQKRRYMPGWHMNWPNGSAETAPRHELPVLTALPRAKQPEMPQALRLALNDVPDAYLNVQMETSMPPAIQPDPPDSTKGFIKGDEETGWTKSRNKEETGPEEKSNKMGILPLFSFIIWPIGILLLIYTSSEEYIFFIALLSLLFLVFGFYYMGKDYGRERKEFYTFSHVMLWIALVINTVFLFVASLGLLILLVSLY